LPEKKVIAVTGASGFLAGFLLDSLREKGADIIEIDQRTGADILDFEKLKSLPAFHTLVHLAARTFVPDSYKDSLGYFSTNVTGTLNCLELCKLRKADFIFASTYVYGKPERLPVDENHPVSMWQPYAASKIIGESLCQAYSRNFGINCCILRIFNMYGPGQDVRFLIPTIIEGLKGHKLSLKTSTPRRDFVYVLDVVSAIEKCLDAGIKGTAVYNVGTGQSHNVAEVVGIIKELMKSDATVSYEEVRREAEVDDVFADISKIKKELGWNPAFDLQAGLKRYVDTIMGRK
jgi:nucleoside-diphosphate-sugar epimerase